VNGATLTTDRFGVANKAYSFDGIDDNILYQMNNTIAPNSYNEYSISFWFNSGSLTNSGRIFQFHEGLTSNTSNYDILINESNTPQGSLSIVHYLGNNSTYSPNPININIWSFCSIVFNHLNNTFTCYLNGFYWFSGNVGSNHPSSGLLSVGSQINNFSTFLGKIDDIGIWNRSLNDCEIQDLYNSQINSVPGLISVSPQPATIGSSVLLSTASQT
jgi:hypothetical protein